MHRLVLISIPLILLTACPEPIDDGGADEVGDSETGSGDSTESSSSADASETDASETDASETDASETDASESSSETTDTGEPASECAAACAVRVECGLVPADQLETCVADCEAIVEAHAQVFGEACSQAQLAYQVCALTMECGGSADECEPIGIDAYFACTETIIPEIDALCECLTQDVPPEPSDPLPPKQSCVVDVGETLIGYGQEFGADCFSAYVSAYACVGAVCADPACEGDPPDEACQCTAQEDAVVMACE